jgi:hypothetical protein
VGSGGFGLAVAVGLGGTGVAVAVGAGVFVAVGLGFAPSSMNRAIAVAAVVSARVHSGINSGAAVTAALAAACAEVPPGVSAYPTSAASNDDVTAATAQSFARLRAAARIAWKADGPSSSGMK